MAAKLSSKSPTYPDNSKTELKILYALGDVFNVDFGVEIIICVVIYDLYVKVFILKL